MFLIRGFWKTAASTTTSFELTIATGDEDDAEVDEGDDADRKRKGLRKILLRLLHIARPARHTLKACEGVEGGDDGCHESAARERRHQLFSRVIQELIDLQDAVDMSREQDIEAREDRDGEGGELSDRGEIGDEGEDPRPDQIDHEENRHQEEEAEGDFSLVRAVLSENLEGGLHDTGRHDAPGDARCDESRDSDIESRIFAEGRLTVGVGRSVLYDVAGGGGKA